MVSGFFNQRIAVSKVDRVFDGRGGFREVETPIGTFWASVHPLSLSERVNYNALDMEINFRVYMRYHPEIKEGALFTFDNQRYRVIGVLNFKYRNEFIELIVSEV